MTAGLRHQLREDGTVDLTLTARNGIYLSVNLPRSQVTAKAWGLLADLDPDPVEPQGQAVGVVEARPRSSVLILLALERGPATVDRIKRLTALTANQISGQLVSHRNQGRVIRTDGGAGIGSVGVYKITPAGVAWLAPRRPS